MGRRWNNRLYLILISFVPFHSFAYISFVLFISFLNTSFGLWTTTLRCQKAVDDTRETKEEYLARMEDEKLWRLTETMVRKPRTCI